MRNCENNKDHHRLLISRELEKATHGLLNSKKNQTPKAPPTQPPVSTGEFAWPAVAISAAVLLFAAILACGLWTASSVIQPTDTRQLQEAALNEGTILPLANEPFSKGAHFSGSASLFLIVDSSMGDFSMNNPSPYVGQGADQVTQGSLPSASPLRRCQFLCGSS